MCIIIVVHTIIKKLEKMGAKFYLLNLLVSIYSMLTIHVAVCMNDTTYETNTKGEVTENSNINISRGKKI